MRAPVCESVWTGVPVLVRVRAQAGGKTGINAGAVLFKKSMALSYPALLLS